MRRRIGMMLSAIALAGSIGFFGYSIKKFVSPVIELSEKEAVSSYSTSMSNFLDAQESLENSSSHLMSSTIASDTEKQINAIEHIDDAIIYLSEPKTDYSFQSDEQEKLKYGLEMLNEIKESLNIYISQEKNGVSVPRDAFLKERDSIDLLIDSMGEFGIKQSENFSSFIVGTKKKYIGLIELSFIASGLSTGYFLGEIAKKGDEMNER
ncbi:MAG: hypothetical protein NTV63_01400 [Candidatus Woesearchaeota archaeon]|nr:hypothetical protein [Candidatus Woesearchaeota archaeon]